MCTSVLCNQDEIVNSLNTHCIEIRFNNSVCANGDSVHICNSLRLEGITSVAIGTARKDKDWERMRFAANK